MSVKPYYERDGITIYHGDCREILPTLAADVMVTDPPYGSNYSSGRNGPYRGVAIANDQDVSFRDEVLALWKGPALVFGEWRNPVPNARQAMVWDKGLAAGMGDLSIPWKPNWEMVFVIGTGFSGKRTSGILVGSVVTWASKGRVHPNMKPVSLMADLIAKCPAGLVLDPFMGSGTTLVAAKLGGRRAIGIEIEERYCEIAAKRLAQGVLPFGGAT